MPRFILKTNITKRSQIIKLQNVFEKQRRVSSWSIDMDDIDRVLVVDSDGSSRQHDIIQLVQAQGIDCAELPD